MMLGMINTSDILDWRKRKCVLRALTADDNHAEAAEEVADVVTMLCRLMTRMGRNLGEEVAREMAINRTRDGISRPTATATTSSTK
jgi:NTP pyrophosphatase (non-canonical NTP hydrolase)